MNATRTSPSQRWADEHRAKVAHRTRAGAWWHALQLNFSPRARQAPRWSRTGPWRPYWCRWDGHYLLGETARRHWHVGRAGKRSAWRESVKGTVMPSQRPPGPAGDERRLMGKDGGA